MKKKKKVECKNCVYKTIRFFTPNWQWCNKENQYNFNGRCEHYKSK